MYSVTIRESVMIAHSLADPLFGPAQNLHGATYIVDVEFLAESLDAHNTVIDIAWAREVTKRALAPIAYQNLDELETFSGTLTTAEYLARHIHDAVRAELAAGFSGRLKIRLGETHDAWVSYEG